MGREVRCSCLTVSSVTICGISFQQGERSAGSHLGTARPARAPSFFQSVEQWTFGCPYPTLRTRSSMLASPQTYFPNTRSSTTESYWRALQILKHPHSFLRLQRPAFTARCYAIWPHILTAASRRRSRDSKPRRASTDRLLAHHLKLRLGFFYGHHVRHQHASRYRRHCYTRR